MKVLLDECVPWPMHSLLAGHECMTAQRRGWGGIKNGDLLRLAEREKGFGAVKAKRDPLPMCRAEVDPCYSHRRDELGCRNPEFYELPVGQPTFRVVARVRNR